MQPPINRLTVALCRKSTTDLYTETGHKVPELAGHQTPESIRCYLLSVEREAISYHKPYRVCLTCMFI